MSQSDEQKKIHLHRISVPCSLHGGHVYFVCGMDHAADDAAAFLCDTLRRNRFDADHTQTLLDVATLRSSLFDDGMDVDDIPF